MKITVDGVEYTEKQIKDVASLALIFKNDPASTTLTAPALHGPFQGNSSQFGIFSTAGARPEMWSTFARPHTWLDLVPVEKSVYVNEILDVMSGVTAAAGTNATSFCGNPPTVGQGKVCRQQYAFGSYFMKTNINSVPELGQLRDRRETFRKLLNNPPSSYPFFPDDLWRFPMDTYDQLQYEMFLMGVHMERVTEKVGITGDITQSSANTELGWFKEFNGLDLQIKTGYTDSDTGLACPAMDSAIIGFNTTVGGTIGGGDGRNITQTISDLQYGLQDRGTVFGMPGFQNGWLMRRELFRALTEVYACNYNTYRCVNTNAGQPQTQDSVAINALRLEMLNGQYLLIDGVQVPVAFSDGIPLDTTANNTYTTDIYSVPFAWNGIPLLRYEYFDMDNSSAQNYSNYLNGDARKTMNNGMYFVSTRDNGNCLEYLFSTKGRLILETPWLAGRIDNVTFTFQSPIRQAYPGDSMYANGGATFRS